MARCQTRRERDALCSPGQPKGLWGTQQPGKKARERHLEVVLQDYRNGTLKRNLVPDCAFLFFPILADLNLCFLVGPTALELLLDPGPW